jgi:hypothetical protein
MIYSDLAPGLFGEDKYSRAGTDGDRFLGACTLVSLSASSRRGTQRSLDLYLPTPPPVSGRIPFFVHCLYLDEARERRNWKGPSLYSYIIMVGVCVFS